MQTNPDTIKRSMQRLEEGRREAMSMAHTLSLLMNDDIHPEVAAMEMSVSLVQVIGVLSDPAYPLALRVLDVQSSAPPEPEPKPKVKVKAKPKKQYAKKPTDWSRFGECPVCGAAPGKPCVSMGGRGIKPGTPIQHPHPNRPKKETS